MNKQSKVLLKQAAYYIKKAEFEKQSVNFSKAVSKGIEGLKGLLGRGKGGKTVEAPKPAETPIKYHRTFYQIPDNELYLPGEISTTGNPVFTPEASTAARHALDDGYWGFRINDMYKPIDGYNYSYHYIPHNPGRRPLRRDFDGFFADDDYTEALDRWLAFNRDRAAHPSSYPFDAKLFEKNITEGVNNRDFPKPRKLSPYQYISPIEQKMLDQTAEQLYPFKAEKPLGIMRDWTERTFTPEYKIDLQTQYDAQQLLNELRERNKLLFNRKTTETPEQRAERIREYRRRNGGENEQ